jgi:hypothetical protein
VVKLYRRAIGERQLFFAAELNDLIVFHAGNIPRNGSVCPLSRHLGGMASVLRPGMEGCTNMTRGVRMIPMTVISRIRH